MSTVNSDLQMSMCIYYQRNFYSIKLTSDVPCINERHKKPITTHFAAETMSPESKHVTQLLSKKYHIFILQNILNR